MGTHILGIKDMAGSLQALRRRRSSSRRSSEEVGIPIHFHTHDTRGVQRRQRPRAADAGVDIVDAALASMSGLTSPAEPQLAGGGPRGTERDPKLDQPGLQQLATTGRRCASSTRRSSRA